MSTSDDIASLKQDLAKVRERFEAKADYLEKFQDQSLAEIKEANEGFIKKYEPKFAEMTAAVQRSAALANRPFYKSPSFWGGLSLIPSIIAGGWLVKAVFGEPALMRLIHKGFGTEMAMIEAISGDDGDVTLQDAIETAVAKQLGATDSQLKKAITAEVASSNGALTTEIATAYLKQDQAEAFLVKRIKEGSPDLPRAILDHENFKSVLADVINTEVANSKTALTSEIETAFLKQEQAERFLAQKIKDGSPDLPDAIVNNENFKSFLSREVDTRFQTFHLTVLKVGLLDPEKKLISTETGAEDNGQQVTASTVFAAPKDEKIVIKIGMAAKLINMDVYKRFVDAKDGEEEELFRNLFEQDYRPHFDEVLVAQIGETDVKFNQDGPFYEHSVDGKRELYATYTSDPIDMNSLENADKLPLHTLSFTSTSTEDFFARIAVIVQREEQREEEL